MTESNESWDLMQASFSVKYQCWEFGYCRYSFFISEERWKRPFPFWNATCCLAIGDEYDINIPVLFTCEILAHSAPQAVAWKQLLALPSSCRLIHSAGRRFRGVHFRTWNTSYCTPHMKASGWFGFVKE